MKRGYAFYVYILSNPGRTVLYIGLTENIVRRLQEHIDNKEKISRSLVNIPVQTL